MDISFDIKPPAKEGMALFKWQCPNCGQRLGDVMGERVVIRISERRISVPLRDGIDQACWKCGTHSELRLAGDSK